MVEGKGIGIGIDHFFAGGSYDVYVDFTKKDGTAWKDLHTTFYSID